MIREKLHDRSQNYGGTKEGRIMKRMHRFSLFVVALAALWVLAVVADAQAQGKGQKKDTRDKGKKKNEQIMTVDSKAAKVKYQPRGMTDRDMIEWTDGNPPGWSRGNKTGWGGAGAPPGQMKKQGEIMHIYPPGSANWDSRTKENWLGGLEQSKARILERIQTRDRESRENEEGVRFSIEGAARAGVPIDRTEAIINRAIDRGMRGRDLEKVTRAMAYGADKGADYDKLDQFIEKKMSEGETGDDLALSIYRQIDEQHTAPPPLEPIKKSWWDRLFGR
jgi:hypothetical protein